MAGEGGERRGQIEKRNDTNHVNTSTGQWTPTVKLCFIYTSMIYCTF